MNRPEKRRLMAPSSRRFSSCFLAVALWGSLLTVTGKARAEEPPSVAAVVPGFRSDPTEAPESSAAPAGDAAPATPKSGPPVTFDALLPASTPFDLRVRAPESGDIGGSVEFWPNEGDCAPEHATKKQHHQLRLTPSGEKDDRVLHAVLPALQVDQKFCFRFNVRRTPTDGELERIAIAASDQLLSKVIAGGECYSVTPDSQTAFVEALRGAVSPLRTEDTLAVAADVALRAFAVKSRTSCVPLREAAVRHDVDVQALTSAQNAVAAATLALKTSPTPGPQRAPFVRLKDKVMSAQELFSKGIEESDLEAASEKLAVRASAARSGLQRAALQAWSNALSNLKTELDAAKNDAARSKILQGWKRDIDRPEGGRLPALPWIELASGNDFVSAEDYKNKPLNPADAAKELDAVARVPNAVSFKKAIEDYEKALANRDDANTAAAADKDEQAKQTDATREALLASFKSDATRGALVVAFTDSVSGSAGEGKTPAAANYAALDAGVAVARPSGSDAQHVWVLPYVGLNLYAVPVDRTVSMGELVGSPVWQRLSLTIGMTLTEPSLRGRSIKSVLFDNYPLAALGLRVTPFTRVTAGGIFYWLDARNPASSDVELHVAPYLAASLDIDLIHMLTQAKL